VTAGLYLHVPFCSAVCPYCDFAVRVAGPDERQRLVDALIEEIRRAKSWSVPISTIYFGGGTPSLLTADQLATVLDVARTSLPIEPDAVLHMEVNPEDICALSGSTPIADNRQLSRIGIAGDGPLSRKEIADNAPISGSGPLDAWRDLGVKFLSLGVQSFDDRELKWLGRRHTGEMAKDAVARALASGIPTVSVDLIYGLPRQTQAQLDVSLDALASLAPQHASLYQLTIAPGTSFGRRFERGKLKPIDEDTEAALFAHVHERLSAQGLHAYEVSNFATGDAHRSLHNQKYWAHVPYLGVGPSAHSFDGQRRWWNIRDSRQYVTAVEAGDAVMDADEELTSEDLALERLMLGLRTIDGVDTARFKSDFDVDLKVVNKQVIADLVTRNYLDASQAQLKPTRPGMAVADWLAGQFELS
jgi:oxygen-independent coproporphyrinogen-3 oxidase